MTFLLPTLNSEEPPDDKNQALTDVHDNYGYSMGDEFAIILPEITVLSEADKICWIEDRGVEVDEIAG